MSHILIFFLQLSYFSFFSWMEKTLNAYHRELRCLRNTIHCNLFITYIFSALLWLLTLSFQVSFLLTFRFFSKHHTITRGNIICHLMLQHVRNSFILFFFFTDVVYSRTDRMYTFINPLAIF